MAYRINRTLGWIGESLDRARGGGLAGDASNPSVIPDVILPKVDIFGWEALQRMKTATATAAVGIESVQPALSDDWVGILGGAGVPRSVALRIMTGVHIEHDDTAAARRMWFGVLDREGGSTGLPTETGSATLIPNDTPLVVTRVFFLRPLETFVGRIRLLGLTSFLTIFYTWIDLREGEYISGQIF